MDFLRVPLAACGLAGLQRKDRHLRGKRRGAHPFWANLLNLKGAGPGDPKRNSAKPQDQFFTTHISSKLGAIVQAETHRTHRVRFPSAFFAESWRSGSGCCIHRHGRKLCETLKALVARFPTFGTHRGILRHSPGRSLHPTGYAGHIRQRAAVNCQLGEKTGQRTDWGLESPTLYDSGKELERFPGNATARRRVLGLPDYYYSQSRRRTMLRLQSRRCCARQSDARRRPCLRP